MLEISAKVIFKNKFKLHQMNRAILRDQFFVETAEKAEEINKILQCIV